MKKYLRIVLVCFLSVLVFLSVNGVALYKIACVCSDKHEVTFLPSSQDCCSEQDDNCLPGISYKLNGSINAPCCNHSSKVFKINDVLPQEIKLHVILLIECVIFNAPSFKKILSFSINNNIKQYCNCPIGKPSGKRLILFLNQLRIPLYA